MRCIFCKSDSSASVSLEHMVPESMGNVDHVLPLGAVCDSCNQYFARKIERPLLDSPLFRQVRARMEVPNKRGRVPRWAKEDGSARPDYRLMGRFLAKVGLEVLVLKVLGIPEWNDEIVGNTQLDELRSFARFNVGDNWPFAVRTLHPVSAVFTEGEVDYHLLHEFDILLTENSEAYLALSLFGVEFTINLGGRELGGYRQWLEENRFASPLYAEKNA